MSMMTLGKNDIFQNFNYDLLFLIILRYKFVKLWI